MRLVLALLVVTALAASARADGVVIARATGERGGVWTPCGTIYAVGWVKFDVVSVVEGDPPGSPFIGVVGCPDGRLLLGDWRLTLARKKSPRQPALGGSRPPPADLPRWFVTGARPAVPAASRRVARLLGRDRAALERERTRTGEHDGWTDYGPDVAVRYDQDRAVALRARVALGLTCEDAAEWLGYRVGRGRGFPLRRRTACEWPGTSARHRLAAGVAGRLEGEWFELRQTAPPRR